MSFKTWKAEFYPVDAIKATGSDLEAVEHSLRKWTGALRANLKRHGLEMKCHVVSDSIGSLSFNGRSCAMCRRLAKGPGVPDCTQCIGMRANGEVCDVIDGPFFRAGDGDVRPMLRWLRKALARAKREARAPKLRKENERLRGGIGR